MAEFEIRANPDEQRREQVALLLPEKAAILRLVPSIWDRGEELEKLGFKARGCGAYRRRGGRARRRVPELRRSTVPVRRTQ